MCICVEVCGVCYFDSVIVECEVFDGVLLCVLGYEVVG